MKRANPAKRATTHSELAAFKRCPQEHEYRYRFGLRPKALASPSTLIGKAVHKGLEFLYLGEPFEHCVNAAQSIFDNYLVSQRVRELLDDDGREKYRKARALTADILRGYVNHWWGQDHQTARHPITGAPLIEFEFRVPVISPSGKASRLFWLRGKVDRVIVDENGEWWIEDAKGRDDVADRSMQERLILDQQPRLYAWAAQFYLGHPIAGAAFNLFRRKAPGIPSINKNGTVSLQKCDTTVEILTETLLRQDDYLSSVSEAERKEKKLAKGIEFEKYDAEIERLRAMKWFDRVWQRYAEEDLQDVQEELYQASLLMHQCEFPYRNYSACDHWSGCRYKPICRGENWEEMFVQGSNFHPELEAAPDSFHLPLGRPYRTGRHAKRFGFERLLEAVNA